MKKSERLMILATLGALALLLGATIYRQQKIAGEEIVRVEIYYTHKDPNSMGSGETILKYRASGEKAKRVLQQWQLDPKYLHPGTLNSIEHCRYWITKIRRNGERSKDGFNLESGLVFGWYQDGNVRSQGKQRFTPQSLKYFRSLLNS